MPAVIFLTGFRQEKAHKIKALLFTLVSRLKPPDGLQNDKKFSRILILSAQKRHFK